MFLSLLIVQIIVFYTGKVVTALDPSDHFLGCFSKPGASFNQHLRSDKFITTKVDRANATACVTFCAESLLYTFAGLEYSGNCYCFENLLEYHFPLENRTCDKLCKLNDHAQFCEKYNTFKVYNTCPVGRFRPPVCGGVCPDYCDYKNTSYCLYNGDCAVGCVNNLCATLVDRECEVINGIQQANNLPFYEREYEIFQAGTYVFPDLQFQYRGLISQIEVLARPEGKVYVGIWEIDNSTADGQQVYLMHKIQLAFASKGMQKIPLSSSDPYYIVKAGQAVGIHMDEGISDYASATNLTSDDFTVLYGTSEVDKGAKAYLMPGELMYDDGSWQPQNFTMDVTLSSTFYAAAIKIFTMCLCPENCNAAVCNDSLICTEGCQPGWQGDTCEEACDEGWYGYECMQPCSVTCSDEGCHHMTGECLQGCDAGYKGLLCNENCDYGRFGDGCSESCSAYCRFIEGQQLCDFYSGECTNGCISGYFGPSCTDGCPSGTYGLNCSENCQHCKNGTICNNQGLCPDGCESNYFAPVCKYSPANCMPDFYGPSCDLRCGKCKNGEQCHFVDGTCEHGCQPGYQEPLCQDHCGSGLYGFNCTRACGDCKYSATTTCHPVDGKCLEGCRAGFYEPPACNNGKCLPLFYGENCAERCGNCMDLSCDSVTGDCKLGCIPGYRGSKCKDPCPHGWYGLSCEEECGSCSGNETCHLESGHCMNGCLPGYQDPFCLDVCLKGFYGDCEKSCDNCIDRECFPTTGHCIKGCLGNFKAPVCVECEGGYGTFCEYKCGHCKNNELCNKRDGSCDEGCQDGFMPPLCKERCSLGFTGANCSTLICGKCKDGVQCKHELKNYCPAGCQVGYEGPLCLECTFGYFGANCSERIGFCDHGMYDKETGVCLQGCTGNYLPPFCKVCRDGFWGFDCQQRCPDCEVEHSCRVEDGMCVNECTREEIERDPECSLRRSSTCSPGYYGDKCLNQCGSCRKSTSCDTKSGNCLLGCEGNYDPPKCTECLSGYYGFQCLYSCGSCKNGTACNPITGHCPGECATSKISPPMCKYVGMLRSGPNCPNRKYGSECNKDCGECLDEQQCLPDGRCPRGCARGFQPPFCVDQCRMGTYGQNCFRYCGLCTDITSCDPVSGTCEGGCVAGYVEPLCQQRKSLELRSTADKTKTDSWLRYYYSFLTLFCLSATFGLVITL